MISLCACVQPSFSKDGGALHKFLQFDTKINIALEDKVEKAIESFIICCYKLENCKTTLLLPTPMAVSLYCAHAAEHMRSSLCEYQYNC